jgi:hypothetical protein
MELQLNNVRVAGLVVENRCQCIVITKVDTIKSDL